MFDRKIALVLDHFVPNKDIKAAQQCKQTRQFANQYDIVNFFDVGEMGIEHALLPEKGLVGPGDCVIGADSHTLLLTAHWEHFPRVWVQRICAAGMITGKACLRFLLP